jgi:hypothetical protein
LQIANDLASVLNDSDRLRILPIVGVGGHQNIRDVRYLKGVDIGPHATERPQQLPQLQPVDGKV